MTIQEEIKQLENEVNYLFDKFTRAAHSRSGSILKEMTEKKKMLSDLKKQLSNQ